MIIVFIEHQIYLSSSNFLEHNDKRLCLSLKSEAMWLVKTMNCFRQDVYFAEIVCDLNKEISTTKALGFIAGFQWYWRQGSYKYNNSIEISVVIQYTLFTSDSETSKPCKCKYCILEPKSWLV